ncbi:PIN2/TERF1-interacting telomerase inhibitor 1 [Gadus morhua]|uniref:PIN2 (TERF1) interacting telomerase inhibitor 1 n=1 Tax=Gadus morhua TaxID=8049 RepID=A0A8C4ZEN0_GADMO|nr:PIN2/TERF1-interacting telomerase inhibitor 1 [Gadus morhua]
MSMLAEPRKKQKWSIDPRNSAWSKDESKFGQKMLERMGWSKGKGLGRSQQGSTEHIKVKVKNNNLGLGTNASYEDNWIAHQDDFNQLLADLNTCHSQPNEKKTPSEDQKSFSLEEKSKTSKKRVHYMKFTKGKDLSNRSKTDLNCIFGRRAKHSGAPIKEEENNGCDSLGVQEVKMEVKEEEEEKPISAGPQPDLDVEGITKTVTSTLTMQEYFAQRMARLKGSRGQAQDPVYSLASVVTTEATETSDPDPPSTPTTPEPDDVNRTTEKNSDEEPKKKRKKSKKNKEREVSDVEVEEPEVLVASAEVEEDANQEQVCPEKTKKKKNKKNKRKAAEVEEAVPGNSSVTEENPGKKKKKAEELCIESNLEGGHAMEDQTAQSDATNTKKKRKRRKQMDSEVAEEEIVVPERKSKKDKKKRE